MNISLPEKMYELVQKKVKSGMCSNTSEVVRDALRRLEEQQASEADWDKLNEMLLKGEKSGRSNKSVTDLASQVRRRVS